MGKRRGVKQFKRHLGSSEEKRKGSLSPILKEAPTRLEEEGKKRAEAAPPLSRRRKERGEGKRDHPSSKKRKKRGGEGKRGKNLCGEEEEKRINPPREITVFEGKKKRGDVSGQRGKKVRRRLSFQEKRTLSSSLKGQESRLSPK